MQTGEVDIGGVRLFVRTDGTSENALVVPNAIYMESDFAWLANSRTVVFYDLRNRGRSETIDDRSKLERGVHQDVEDLEGLRRHFGFERIDLLGHSYLGLVVALYAMRYPERVRRIVQLSPAAADPSKRYPPEFAFADGVVAEVMKSLGELQARRGDYDPIAFCKAAWSQLRRMYVSDPAHLAKIEAWGYCDLPNERNMLRHFNENVLPTLKALALTRADYERVSAPLLTIHGTRDRSAPYGGGRDWAASFPHARLLTVSNAGHVPWVEDPEVVPAIQTFLEGNWPASAENVHIVD